MTLALVVGLTGIVALTAAGCGGDAAARDADDRIVEAGDLPSIALQEGDCFVPPEDNPAEVTSVEGVACDAPHHHEVIALVTYDEGQLRPDDGELGAFAAGACLAEFEPYVRSDYLESSLMLTYLLPSIRSWNEIDDRSVVCVAHSPDRALTSSVRGSGI